MFLASQGALAQFSGTTDPLQLGTQNTLGQGTGGLGTGSIGTSSSDCSDPLMASSAQCMGLSGQSNPFTLMGANGMTAGIGQLPNGSYSDTELLANQAASARFQQPTAPEPLTDFQKFVASTTGQVLPIFGAELFQRVPSTFAPIQLAPVPPDYVIGPGDELRIRVWGQINSQSNVRVDRSGDIYLPHVGPVHVAELPFSQLEQHLREALGRVYKNFDLTVDVGQIRSIQIYITGAARRPGAFTVSSLSTMVNALFASGGPAIQGSLRRIELRRDGAVVTTFDLYSLLINGDKSKDVKLLDGDVIYIPPVGEQAAIVGSVRMAGIYELVNGESLAALMKFAGGTSALASGSRISIERNADGRNREVMEFAADNAGEAAPIADGDLVRVYSIVPSYQKTVTLRGNIANPGRFAWHQGMRISELIPDKDSLLTRNYWWRRAQIGLPAPEFELLPALGEQHQPMGNSPVTIPGYDQQNLPPPGMQLPGQTGTAPQTQNTSAAALGAAAQNQNTTPPSEQLTAEQRGSSASLAAGQTNQASTSTIPAEQRLDIKLSAPEIDWDYAVIERLDANTLQTKLIPFDLGKLVLQHDSAQDLELQPGDVVTIFSQADIRVPLSAQTKLVHLEGEFVHSGIYSVQPGETLRQLVARAGGFTPKAYLYGSEFTRESTRSFQQARIDEYVQSMNLSTQRGTLALVAQPAASAQDMASSAAAANLEKEFLASLKQIRATGRIVLEFKPASQAVSGVPDIEMEDGDRFVVPPLPASVNVVGAVYDQNAFLYRQGRRVQNYMQQAGGANRDADRHHAFIIRADGQVVSYEMARGPWGNNFNNLPMYPGDTIVIPDKTLKPSVLRGVLDWSQLFSQFALGAAALAIIAP